MKHLFWIALSVTPLASATAQTPADLQAKMAANPVSQTTRVMFEQHAKNMVSAAELMPADKYGFHPTEAQMTFGKLIAHIVQTNEFICSAIAGTVKDPPSTPTEKDTKEVLVNAIKDSFNHCSAVLQSVTDSQIGEMIAMGGQKLPRVYFMMTLIADWADHYSTEASYLRLNGILPPTARQPGK